MWLVFGAVYTILGATALILEGIGGEATVADQRSPDGRTFACAQIVAANAFDDGYCGRLVKDLMRRPELTPEQQSRMAAQVNAVEAAINELSWCDYPAGPPPHRSQCANFMIPGGEQVSQARADALQKLLLEAGFIGAIVRVVQADDPAPRGAIIYAVPVGDACVLGHAWSPSGGGSSQLVAPLPNGRCL
jgi:hypothetical protein